MNIALYTVKNSEYVLKYTKKQHFGSEAKHEFAYSN